MRHVPTASSKVFITAGLLALSCSDDKAATEVTLVSSALTWQELACQLSDQHNTGWQSWWNRIPNEPDLAQIFWHELVGKGNATACSAVVETMFWDRAVPLNWAWQNTGMPGWPWNEGGYFTQMLWTRAIPDNWMWQSTKLPGWPWGEGGYYTQKFWVQMVPEDRGPRTDSLGRYHDHYRPCCPVQNPTGPEQSYGYYRYWFWEKAVPDDWATWPDIGGWYNGSSGGYYKQWLWLHAIPDEWVRQPGNSVGGQSNRGYYLWEFYQNAMSRDYAWQPNLVRNGIPGGAGYYGFYFQDSAFLNMLSSSTRAKYAALLKLAGAAAEPGLGYLRNATGVRKVRDWWSSSARAVVIFTFDNHAQSEDHVRIVKQALDAEGVTKSTWFLTTEDFGRQLVRDYDLGNHTWVHQLRTWYTLADNISDLDLLDVNWNTRLGRAVNPANTFNSYRAPLCDGQKSFDQSVLDAFAHFANGRGASNLSDSSVFYLSPSVIAAGFPPPWGVRQFTVTDYPYPFRIRPGVVEFPAAYPSDGIAWFHHMIEDVQTPTVGGNRWGPGREYAVNLWKKAFDDVYAQEGVMTLILHPHHMGAVVGGVSSPAIRELIQYMKTKSGVVFTDLEEATRRFNLKYPG